MDNFKFMDSWPSWVRWLAVLIIITATVLWWLVASPVYTWLAAQPYDFGRVVWILWLIWTAAFLWCCVAAAPRFKVAVALLLGLVSLCMASYAFYLLGPERWRLPRSLWDFFIFLFDPYSWPYAMGLLITCLLVVWGLLQRRLGASVFARMMPWLGLGSVLFVGLSVANFVVWVNAFDDFALRFGGVPNAEAAFNVMTYWLIGREVALVAAALLGVWLPSARFSKNKERQSLARLKPT